MDADDQCNLIRSWIERQVLEQMADYIGRGRRLAAKDFAELRRHWMTLMRLWGAKTASAEDHKLREDIQAEMRIRGFQPPYNAVKDVLVQLAAMSRDVVERSRPQERRRFGRMKDDQFQALRESTKATAKN
jgi:hypothetical protein